MKCSYRHCDKEIPPDRARSGMKYCLGLHRRQEHAIRRNERNIKKKKVAKPKPVKSIQILCPCGCWNFFFTEKRKPQRMYYKAYPCRHIHYKKLNGVKQNPNQVISKRQHSATIQNLPCHKVVMGNSSRKIACADYSECLEGVAMGGVFKCADGVNRYREPHEVQVNTTGGSFASACCRGYSFT